MLSLRTAYMSSKNRLVGSLKTSILFQVNFQPFRNGLVIFNINATFCAIYLCLLLLEKKNVNVLFLQAPGIWYVGKSHLPWTCVLCLCGNMTLCYDIICHPQETFCPTAALRSSLCSLVLGSAENLTAFVTLV